MAQKKQTPDEVIEEIIPPLRITAVSLKDDFCDYSYEITNLVGIGNIHNVKGKGIIDEDLRTAFNRLNVHLGVIDGKFGIVEQVEDLRNDEDVALYNVTGIKMRGSSEDESVILTGTKFCPNISGRIDLTTAKIALKDFSAYKPWMELQEDIELIRKEAELYHGGKCTSTEVKVEDPNQKEFHFPGENGGGGDFSFDEAKV